MLIQALDEFVNPVSNVPVTFLVDPYVEEIFECDPPQEDPQNAAVFDLNLLAPPEDVTARVTSERGAYAVGEIVNLTAEVDYRSGKEDILDTASVRLTLLDVNRSVVKSSEKSFRSWESASRRACRSSGRARERRRGSARW